ncbi:glutathione S-transferase family protein [Tropicibacter sp. S64]|uniref:glutathione S-transferase family protein n=1 Tax=Tropicibacter sp. S64 TaxID=3415122 RepID=UPI003C7A51E5
MLTLYYAPQSRATRVLALLHELGAADKVEIRPVTLRRHDNTGAADPANPHPEGKVPLLVHDGVAIRESDAIMIHLCTLFPEAGLMPQPGTPEHGAFLSWMAWYGNVMEPVIVGQVAGIEHPAYHATFRGLKEMQARVTEALSRGPWLLGARMSAADILVCSTFLWMPDSAPRDAAVQDWIKRCAALPGQVKALAFEATLQAAA